MNKQTERLLVMLLSTLLLLIAACQDNRNTSDDEAKEGQEEVHEKPPAKETGAGVLLRGEPGARAFTETYDLHVPAENLEGEISEVTANGGEVRVLRTELELILSFEAESTAVNDLLSHQDALIVSMTRGVPVMVIRFPDPGGMEELRQLKEKLESTPEIYRAILSVMIEEPVVEHETHSDPKSRNQIAARNASGGEESVLPPYLQQSFDGHYFAPRINHQLAVRAHSAWNLSSELQPLSGRPWLVVGDLFGDGAPDAAYDVNIEADDFATDDVNSHGYHVLGITTGTFDPPDSINPNARRDVTGMVPVTLNTRIVDLMSDEANTWPRRRAQLVQRMNDIVDDHPTANIVGNTSLNSRNLDDDNQNDQALAWVMQLRFSLLEGWPTFEEMITRLTTPGSGMEGHLLHFTSSGNLQSTDPDDFSAVNNSIFAEATLGSLSWETTTVPTLNNTFVVENRTNLAQSFPDRRRPVPACNASNSVPGGNLSGIGTDVWSHGRCTNATWNGQCLAHDSMQASEKSGTSMATPQAAGVAALVWSLDPTLSVQAVKAIIEDTADPAVQNGNATDTCSTDPLPIIDAYAAVLAAGGDDARLVLLDVTGSGDFNENDVQAFMDRYDPDVDESEMAFEYSVYDLAGDGLTGSRLERRERFDLSGSGFNPAIRDIPSIAGSPLFMQYDTDAVSDWDVLCYYAYSDLYSGNTTIRDDLLMRYCRGARISVRFRDADSGNTLTGIPLSIVDNAGAPLPHDIRVVDDQLEVWVPAAAGEGYYLQIPEEYNAQESMLVGTLEHYEHVRRTLNINMPEPELNVFLPTDGAMVAERESMLVMLVVSVPTANSTITIKLGNNTLQTFQPDTAGHHTFYQTLHAQDICPAGAQTLEVTMTDDLGNSATVTRAIEIAEAPLRTQIHGEELIEVRYDPTAAPNWYVPWFTVQGEARKPTCADPYSSDLDQSQLVWENHNSAPPEAMGTGPELTLGDNFFRTSAGELVGRDLGLRFEFKAEEALTVQTLTPCYGTLVTRSTYQASDDFGFFFDISTMEYPYGPEPRTSFPACHFERDSTWYGPPLIDFTDRLLFELELARQALEVQPILDDIFGGLLGDLGNPDPFPAPLAEVIKQSGHTLGGDLANQFAGGLSQLLDGTPAVFQRKINDVRAHARESLNESDYMFFEFAVSVVSDYVHMFSGPDDNGTNAWSRFSFVGEDPHVLNAVDEMAPARGALSALIQSVSITAEKGNLTTAEIGPSLGSSAYGALSAAGDELVEHYKPHR